MPSAVVHLVGEDEIDDLRYSLGCMLRSLGHGGRDAAMRKLAELRPEYLEQTMAGDEVRASVYCEAVQELRRRGYEFRGPLRYRDVLDLPRDLAFAACEAYDGKTRHLLSAATYRWGRQHPFGLWARALRFVEFRLNDPDDRRAAAVASAFRSRGVGLRLVDGRYRVVSYDAPVPPPVALEVELDYRDLRVGDSVPVAVVERARSAGARICFDGEWSVTVSGPGGSVIRSARDGAKDGAKDGPRFVRLEAGARRRTEVTSHLFRRPGRHTISATKVYERDDRRDGGAWTGAVHSAVVGVEVRE